MFAQKLCFYIWLALLTHKHVKFISFLIPVIPYHVKSYVCNIALEQENKQER